MTKKCKKCDGKGRVRMEEKDVIGYKICPECNGEGFRWFLDHFIEFMSDSNGLSLKDIQKEIKELNKSGK